MKHILLVITLLINSVVIIAQPHNLPPNSIELIPGQVYGNYNNPRTHGDGAKTTSSCPGTCDLNDILVVGNISDHQITITDDLSANTILFSNGIYQTYGGYTQAELGYSLSEGAQLLLKDDYSSNMGAIHCGSISAFIVDNIIEAGNIMVHDSYFPITVTSGSSMSSFNSGSTELVYGGVYQGAILQNSDNSGMDILVKGAGPTTINYVSIKSSVLSGFRQQYWPDDSGTYQISHSNTDVQTVSSTSSITIIFNPPIHFVPSNVMIIPKSLVAAEFWHSNGYISSITSTSVTLSSSTAISGTCVFGYEEIK